MPTAYPIVARASKSVRNKNAIVVLMVIAVAVWFGYDGWVGYATGNDQLVSRMIAMAKENTGLSAEEGKYLEENWPKENGWNTASDEVREHVSALIDHKHPVDGWHTATDIAVQRWIVAGLCIAAAVSLWWFMKCQQRRVIADENTLSPAPGLFIPWANITKVDNRRWKKSEFVDVEYRDAAGNVQQVELDGYIVDDLVPVLDEMSLRADKAEYIDPPEEGISTTPDAPASSGPSAPAGE